MRTRLWTVEFHRNAGHYPARWSCAITLAGEPEWKREWGHGGPGLVGTFAAFVRAYRAVRRAVIAAAEASP
jgi:hypothetical protein